MLLFIITVIFCSTDTISTLRLAITVKKNNTCIFIKNTMDPIRQDYSNSSYLFNNTTKNKN